MLNEINLNCDENMPRVRSLLDAAVELYLSSPGLVEILWSIFESETLDAGTNRLR